MRDYTTDDPALENIKRRRTISLMIASAIVAIAAVLPFFAVMDAPFLHDDHWAVVNNPLVVGDFDIAKIFRSNAWGGEVQHLHIPNYRPLSVVSLAVTSAVAGFNPAPYRAENIALHASVAIAILLLLTRLAVPLVIAFLAALAFAVHGIHAEAVAFVVNREEILATLLVLFAVFVYVGQTGFRDPRHPTRNPQASGRFGLALSAVLFALALLSKENGVALMIILPVMTILWPREKGQGLALMKVIAVLGAVFAVYLTLRLNALGHLGASFIAWQDNPLVAHGHFTRIIGALEVVTVAGRLLVAPFNMTVDYGFNALPVGQAGFSVAAIFGVAIVISVVAIGVAVARSRPLVSLGLGIVATAWFPVSSFAFPSSILFAERSLYMPSAGLVIALAGIFQRRCSVVFQSRFQTVGVIVLSLWSLVLLVSLVDRVPDFKSSKALFSASLVNRPASTRLENNLGVALMDEGDWTSAEKRFQNAVSIDPTNAEAHNNLGLVLSNAGRPGEAVKEFTMALNINPRMTSALVNLCKLLVHHQRYEQAESICHAGKSAGGEVESELQRIREGGFSVINTN